jgi:hypothetical protein
MWQIYAQLAQDLIRERQEEAAAIARSRAERDSEADPRLAGEAEVRRSAVRSAGAAALRQVGAAGLAVARRARDAAARLEGRTA